jgi:hypothetical protein
MRLSEKQKFICSCMVPTADGFATRAEVKAAKLLARGHYWDEPEWTNFVAYSPTGKRMFFQYDWYSWATPKLHQEWKRIARKCARLWAHGKYKEAIDLDAKSYEETL